MIDILAMGAGHNGLVAAAYLAKAGKKVLVLERKAYPGGGVTTRQLNTPGYWHDEHSSVHIMIQGNPMLRQDELGLIGKHGLKYHYSLVPHATIFPDQSALFTYKDIDKTCEGFAKVSAKDAQTYRNFVKTSQQILQVFMPGLYAPPPPLGELVAMLDRSEEGRLMLDYMNRDCLDLVNQLYESDKVKIHLLRLVSENLQAPNELGTGMGVLLMPGIIHTYGVSQPVGGSGKLTEALVRCIKSHGGEVRCNAEVAKILTRGGRASGVRLSSGEEIAARDGVIGALHLHVIRKFVDGVPEPVMRRAERATLAPFSIMVSHYDLKENVKYHAGEEVGYATMLEFMATDKLDEMVADFDALKRGLVTERRLCAGGDESIGDKTRVPPGAGMFHGITFAPYSVNDKRKNVPENRFVGNTILHLLTTPILEVAQDRQSAKGMWYTPGVILTTADGKTPYGMWIWERYGVDFIRKDGRWVFLNIQVNTDFMNPLGSALKLQGPDAAGLGTEGGAQFGPDAVGIKFPGPDIPKSTYSEFGPTRVPTITPRMPEPYRTLKETFQYADCAAR